MFEDTFRNAKVLVTGGLGMVGSSIVRLLSEAGAVTTVMDNGEAYPFDYGRRYGGLESSSHFIAKDIRDYSAVARAVQGQEFVVHAAAYADVSASIRDYREDFECNVLGTMNVLESALKGSVQRVLYVSSASVYGAGGFSTTTFRETDRLDPISTYGNSKLWGEGQSRLFASLYGLNTTCVRYFSVYGPPQVPKPGSQSWCIAIFAMQAMCGVPMTVMGDGTQIRDFTYIDDIVEGTLRGLASPATVGKTYNLGTGQSTRVVDAAQRIAETLGSGEIEFMGRPKGDPEGGHADTDRIEDLLGWRPRISLAEGIQRYLNWLKENRDLIPEWISERKC